MRYDASLIRFMCRRSCSFAILAACAMSLQGCTRYVVAAKSPGDVLAESPHSVRVTMNNGRTVELGKPVVRNGFVVEPYRDSVRLTEIKQVEVPQVERGKTAMLIVAIVGLSVAVRLARGSSQEPDEGPSAVVPVSLIPWP